jgi:ubiquinone/menaquinone biosynthesis C-methylase UbiE
MMQDDLLFKYYVGDWIDHYYGLLSIYFNLLVEKNPTMKVLEIGAGSGGTTLALFRKLTVRQGLSYDFTDISAGFFIKAKELLSEWTSSINYKKLDIETDPVEQGFEEAKYDLVIASNVLHATKHMETTLKNTRKLLKPGGQLMLLEVTTPPVYLHLVFGCLPGWWVGKYSSIGPFFSDTLMFVLRWRRG